MIERALLKDGLDRLPPLQTVLGKLCKRLVCPTPEECAAWKKCSKHVPASILETLEPQARKALEQMGELRQMIVQLGANQVFETISQLAHPGPLPAVIPGYNFRAKVMYLHAVAVGRISEHLTQDREQPFGLLAFTAGFLHDIGMFPIAVLLSPQLAEQLSQINQDARHFARVEKEVLGLDHAEAGEMICEHWGLPPLIGQAIRWHHAPDQAPEGLVRLLSDVLHTADSLALSMGYGPNMGEVARSFDWRAVKRLGLKVLDVERLASETHEKILHLTGASPTDWERR